MLQRPRFRTATLAALPSMSLFRFAPFLIPNSSFRSYFGQAAFSFAAIEAYSSGESFLLGAGVPGGPSPK